MALLGGFAEILDRPPVVLSYALAVVVRRADGVLRARVAPLGGGVGPARAGSGVLIDPAARAVGLAQLVGRAGMTPVGCRPEAIARLGVLALALQLQAAFVPCCGGGGFVVVVFPALSGRSGGRRLGQEGVSTC